MPSQCNRSTMSISTITVTQWEALHSTISWTHNEVFQMSIIWVIKVLVHHTRINRRRIRCKATLHSHHTAILVSAELKNEHFFSLNLSENLSLSQNFQFRFTIAGKESSMFADVSDAYASDETRNPAETCCTVTCAQQYRFIGSIATQQYIVTLFKQSS